MDVDPEAIRALEHLGETWWNLVGWPLLALAGLWILCWAWSRRRPSKPPAD